AIECYNKMHESYLNILNTNDESKNRIRNKIFNLLMEKYQLGKYENSNFSEPLSNNGSDQHIETLYINEEKYNAEVNIYRDYLIFKSINKDKKVISFMYKKESNKYINQDRGELIITKNKIIETDKNGGQNISDYKRIKEMGHNPQSLSKLLLKFSDTDNLSYTNHVWDTPQLTYDEFKNKLQFGWNEIEDDLKKLLGEKTYSNIYKFLFEEHLGGKDKQNEIISWGENITVGWSSKEIVEELKNTSEPKPHLIKLHNMQSTEIKTFGDAIDIFKSYFVIDDKKNKLLKKFTKLRKENSYNIKLNLDSLKETSIDKFFTDVRRFEAALETILYEMNERSEINHDVKVKIEEKIIINQSNEEINVTELKITHINSFSTQSKDRLLDTINRSKGFKSIYENLKSVCDWSIDTKCSDGKRYKIDYLYPEIDNEKPHWDEISDSIDGFTHILRFYR
ncbi:hypothetical protein SAMN06314019_1131, partial [Epsilonproteobacteria bacterium SCGC AD-311-C15]